MFTGSWDDRQVWALIEEDLARRFRVVSYDRRGHAGRGQCRAWVRRDDEDDLAGLIEALGLAPANVVASSLGPRSRSAWSRADLNSSAHCVGMSPSALARG